MGEARKVVERFYQQFGAGDMTEAFACFVPECIANTTGNGSARRALQRPMKGL